MNFIQKTAKKKEKVEIFIEEGKWQKFLVDKSSSASVGKVGVVKNKFRGSSLHTFVSA